MKNQKTETTAEKQALAKRLKAENSDMLQWLKEARAVFGPAKSVEYREEKQ